MSIVIMNIGLAIPQDESDMARGLTRFWTAKQAEQALEEQFAHLGYALYHAKVVESASEPTLVACFHVGSNATKARVEMAAHDLSVALEQDAIAYIAYGDGKLVGPRAALWGGEFKMEFFCF